MKFGMIILASFVVHFRWILRPLRRSYIIISRKRYICRRIEMRRQMWQDYCDVLVKPSQNLAFVSQNLAKSNLLNRTSQNLVYLFEPVKKAFTSAYDVCFFIKRFAVHPCQLTNIGEAKKIDE